MRTDRRLGDHVERVDGHPGSDAAALRVALLSYRSKEHCGGQGVYVRELSKGLVDIGHEVQVFSGPPYPQGLDPRVGLTRVPSLDLYREPDPFRIPHPREFTDAVDVLEYATTLTGCFAEPLAFSVRAARLLRALPGRFDIIHDNQCLGYGLLAMMRDGHPVTATLHHPISRDRSLDLAAAPWWRMLSVARWYGFVRMQARVARRIPALLTVSSTSAADSISDFTLAPDQMHVVPLGVDTDLFAPGPARVPGRIVAVASADRPLKGVVHLLEAVAKVRIEHEVDLQLVSRLEPGGPTERAIAELGLSDCVTCHCDLADHELAGLLGSAEVMCVPSLYEGFSLPTAEAMACATPVLATNAGALPEVVGDCAVVVPPGDSEALAVGLRELLASPEERARLGAAGRQRALQRYSWSSVAAATVDVYRKAIEHRRTAIEQSGSARADR